MRMIAVSPRHSWSWSGAGAAVGVRLAGVRELIKSVRADVLMREYCRSSVQEQQEQRRGRESLCGEAESVCLERRCRLCSPCLASPHSAPQLTVDRCTGAPRCSDPAAVAAAWLLLCFEGATRVSLQRLDFEIGRLPYGLRRVASLVTQQRNTAPREGAQRREHGGRYSGTMNTAREHTTERTQ